MYFPRSSFSLCLPSSTIFLSLDRFNFCFSGNPFHIRPRKCSQFLLSASIAEKNSSLEVSWDFSDKFVRDEYNGWANGEFAPPPVEKKGKGLHTFAVVGVGASVATVLDLIAYFSISSKGFEFRVRSPISALHGFSVPSLINKDDLRSEESSEDLSPEAAEMPEENLVDVSGSFVATETTSNKLEERKLGRVIVPFAVDSAQQEALLALKELKIIEDDARADELCTRREYARWLVHANSQLERSRKHRIISSAALSGSRIAAFDDVRVEDPDFEAIQSLAEAGIVRSKLSAGNSWSNPTNVGDEGSCLYLARIWLVGKQK